MLPHTGLFLLWKVALQMRIRRRLKTEIQLLSRFQTTLCKCSISVLESKSFLMFPMQILRID